MKIKSEELIEDLIERTRKHLNLGEDLNKLTMEELNWREEEGRWNILECLEHLNLYGDFYLPEIQEKIGTSKYKNEERFRSNWFGEYFADSMLPKEKLNKMKTFKSMNPIMRTLDTFHIERFIAQQKQLLDLLHQAREVSLTKTKTGISISKWIRLRLGDTFRVVVYHNQRHVVQVNKIRRTRN